MFLESLFNFLVRVLDVNFLFKEFKECYGDVLEVFVEWGSFVEGEDFILVWDLDWLGLDELMGLLEI